MPPKKSSPSVVTPVVKPPEASRELAAPEAPDNPNREKIFDFISAVAAKRFDQNVVAANTSTQPFVSSGSLIVDHLIGGSIAADGVGRACPGFPRRRVSEIFGAESSGKTTLAISAIAACQRRGGLAMFLDFENALHHGYAMNMGMRFGNKQLIYYNPENMEQGLEMIYLGIRSGVDLIVVDSVAAMVPKAVMEAPADKMTIGIQARLLSQQLPRMIVWLNKNPPGFDNFKGTSLIFINQTRSVIGKTGYGGPSVNTSGGMSLKFYATIRMSLARIRSDMLVKKDIYTGKPTKIPYGNVTKVKIVKNKLDVTQGQSADVFIRYGRGIDDYLAAIELGQTCKVVSKKGSSYSFNGSSFRGRESFRKHLVDNQVHFEALRKAVLAYLAVDRSNDGGFEEDDDTYIEGIEIKDEDSDFNEKGIEEACVEHEISEEEAG